MVFELLADRIGDRPPIERIPSKIERVSTDRVVNSRSGRTTSSAKFVATPSTHVSSAHRTASRPAVIDPPDTLEMRDSRPSQPSSFSRQSVPA